MRMPCSSELQATNPLILFLTHPFVGVNTTTFAAARKTYHGFSFSKNHLPTAGYVGQAPKTRGNDLLVTFLL
jgi:hypothetical protein